MSFSHPCPRKRKATVSPRRQEQLWGGSHPHMRTEQQTVNKPFGLPESRAASPDSALHFLYNKAAEILPSSGSWPQTRVGRGPRPRGTPAELIQQARHRESGRIVQAGLSSFFMAL